MAATSNIIIIEDNETFSLLVTHYLKNNLGNTKVYVENSAARAIQSIQRLNPSLVILDYYLENDLSAKDVMNVINMMPNRPKVILLSSITDEQEKEEVMAMGIERFVKKTNQSFYDLVKAIDEVLVDGETEQEQVQDKQGISNLAIVGLFGIVALVAVLLYLLFT